MNDCWSKTSPDAIRPAGSERRRFGAPGLKPRHPRGSARKPTHDPTEGRSVPEPTDEQLLLAYRQGDDGAFEVLVRRYQPELFRFLFRLMGNRAGAEDVFQEAFVQIHLSADSFDATRRFKPWLFTIAANKARDAMRRNARRKALDLSAPVSGDQDEGGKTYIDLLQIDVPAPDSALSEAELSEMVQRAIDELSVPLREILLLSYFQRLSYNQIADALDIPLGTVKSRLHAAVAAFARKWQVITKENAGP